jgi:hypothetical protein
MTGCGLSTVAAGWLVSSAPQPIHTDAGSVLGSATHHAVSSRKTAASPPTRIHGPKGFDAAVVPVAARADGALALPEDLHAGGWWSLGAAVGSSRGTVLIAGHVDNEGGLGPFAALHKLPVGARIEVTGADGLVRPYRVTARRTYKQEQLPPDLFTSSGRPRLVIVTCTGPYDRTDSRYRRNLVLYATPIATSGYAAEQAAGTGVRQPAKEAKP